MSPDRVARVRELAAAGQSDATIARELGVVPRTVLRARQAHNIPSTWRPTRTGPEHGAPAPYKRGCRCGRCRADHSARLAAAKADRYARWAAGEVEITHGASAYGNWGCRCPTCTRGHSARMAAYKSSRRGQ
ncbi:hypothetical protein [Streptomyces sp. NPDC002526]